MPFPLLLGAASSLASGQDGAAGIGGGFSDSGRNTSTTTTGSISVGGLDRGGDESGLLIAGAIAFVGAVMLFRRR